MKRFLACILALTMVLSLAACGGKAPGPDSIVTKFCDAMKKSDYETMKTCLKTSSEDFDDLESGETGDEEMDFLLDYVKDKNKEMTYKVESVEENDNQGTVKVTFNYNDMSPVVIAALGEYLQQAFAMIFTDVSEEEMSTLFETIFTEKLQSVETTKAEATVEFKCEKGENGWLISEVPDDALHVMTCNVAKAFEGMGDIDLDEEEDADPMENAIWHDVAVGEEAELATIKIRVDGCEETNVIQEEYLEDLEAKAGTKFVVYHVSIVNTTKEETVLSVSDFTLYDHEERQYTPYDEAMWYSDSIQYRSLAPSIPESGTIVYQVPEDSQDYYFALGKSGTEDYFRFHG